MAGRSVTVTVPFRRTNVVSSVQLSNLNAASLRFAKQPLNQLNVNQLRYLTAESPEFRRLYGEALTTQSLSNVQGLDLESRAAAQQALADGNAQRGFLDVGKEQLPNGTRLATPEELEAALRSLQNTQDAVGTMGNIQKSGVLSRSWMWVRKNPVKTAAIGFLAIPALLFLAFALDDLLRNNGRQFDIVSINQGDLPPRVDTDDEETEDDSGGVLDRFDPRKFGPQEQVIDIRFDGDGFTMKEGREVSVYDSNSEPGADGSYTILQGMSNIVKVNCCTLTKAGGAQGYVQYNFSFNDAYFDLWRNYARGVGGTIGQGAGALGGGFLRGLGDALSPGSGGFPWFAVIVVGVVILLLFFFLR